MDDFWDFHGHFALDLDMTKFVFALGSVWETVEAQANLSALDFRQLEQPKLELSNPLTRLTTSLEPSYYSALAQVNPQL